MSTQLRSGCPPPHLHYHLEIFLGSKLGQSWCAYHLCSCLLGITVLHYPPPNIQSLSLVVLVVSGRKRSLSPITSSRVEAYVYQLDFAANTPPKVWGLQTTVHLLMLWQADSRGRAVPPVLAGLTLGSAVSCGSARWLSFLDTCWQLAGALGAVGPRVSHRAG